MSLTLDATNTQIQPMDCTIEERNEVVEDALMTTHQTEAAALIELSQGIPPGQLMISP